MLQRAQRSFEPGARDLKGESVADHVVGVEERIDHGGGFTHLAQVDTSTHGVIVSELDRHPHRCSGRAQGDTFHIDELKVGFGQRALEERQ